MIDIEAKRRFTENAAKIIGLGVISFLVAPIILIVIHGLIGLIVAVAIGGLAINMAPAGAAMLANWRVKALKAVAAANPIETLENQYKDRQGALFRIRDNIKQSYAPAITNQPVATNVTVIASPTNDVAKDYDHVDLTFGASGTTIAGHSELGIDVSASVNPFAAVPSLWVGGSQSLYWEPAFAGSTDLDADWSQQIYKQLYINPGWSVGNVYAVGSQDFWRTGPEVTFQYYTSDDAYLYSGMNWDFVTSGKPGLRWSFGIGIEF